MKESKYMKTITKTLELLLWLLESPMFLLLALLKNHQQKQVYFQLCSEFMSQWPFRIGSLARRVFYKQTLSHCGENPVIRMGAYFIYPQSEVGDNVLIGNRCVIGLSTIGDDVMLAHQVSILSGRHHHQVDAHADLPRRLQESEITRITIGKDAWIGANAVVMADVGDHSIVGAGAVVVHPVKEHSVVVGNPAKPIPQ